MLFPICDRSLDSINDSIHDGIHDSINDRVVKLSSCQCLVDMELMDFLDFQKWLSTGK